jgi:hypothetical protein
VHHDEAFTFSDDFKYGRNLGSWYSCEAIVFGQVFCKREAALSFPVAGKLNAARIR